MFLRKVAGRVAALALAGAVALPVTAHAAEEVNLYTYRQPELMKPLLDAFTAESGITVNMVYDNKSLTERLKAEGENTPADLVITANAGRLVELVSEDLVQPVTSPALDAAVPAHLRDPEGRWYAITKRSRIVYASRERVPADTQITYEDLADPKWKGRICTRPLTHEYTIDLIASLIAKHGEAWTETWLKGFVANLARKPQGNDRGQISAVAQGVCDIAVGNTYYYGLMLANPEQKADAEMVRPTFPNQSGDGAHMNVTGAAVTKHAKHPENARKLIEFLVSPEAQAIYAAQNFEFPVVEGVPSDPVIAVFGNFTEDTLNVAEIGAHRPAAARLVDRSGAAG
ncbi:MAG: Fe(3+) ABC transporter substrate-binding protein [Pseudomonadota bacterium]|nr:Fe(3+) ABC transporter substrate-binding protein [Pseudomonadota bacterium]